MFALEQLVGVTTDGLQQPRLGHLFVLEIHVGGLELGAHKVLLLAGLRAVALLLKLQVGQDLRRGGRLLAFDIGRQVDDDKRSIAERKLIDRSCGN